MFYMKTFRKIVFIILALIPCVSLILTCFFFIGGNLQNVQGSDALFAELVTSPVYIVKQGSVYTLAPLIEGGSFTLLDQGLLSITNNIFATFNTDSSTLAVLYFIQEAGIVITTPMVFSAYYLWYVFVIYIIDMIISLLTFVPRKCSEFLTKGMN